MCWNYNSGCQQRWGEGVVLSPKETSGNVGRHFWLSQLVVAIGI